MDLNLLLNEAIGGRSGRRGGMLERLMRSFLWSAVNQAMSTALETATAPVQARTESRAAAAMETATAVPPPVTLPPAREAFEQVARPERRKSTWDREMERIQLEVTAELETMQPTLGRTPEQFEDVKPYILRTILDTLQEGRQKGMSATDLQRFITPSALIAAADHGQVEEQPRFAAYNLPSDIPERVRMNLTDVNFDRPQEGYQAVRDIPVPFGPQPQAPNVAEQALNQATAPDDTDQWQREMQRIQADVANALAAMGKPDDRDDATWQKDLQQIPGAIEAGLEKERGYGLTADDLKQFTGEPLVQAAIPQVYHNATLNVSKLPPDLIATLKDARAAKQQRDFEPQQSVNVTPQPAAGSQQTQPQPRGQSSQQRGTAAEQAMEEAARATSRNTNATEQLHGPLTALRLAILSMLGFSRNTGAAAAGGGRRGGGNDENPVLGGSDMPERRRERRRQSFLARLTRRGPERAVRRAGAWVGAAVARMSGQSPLQGANTGGRAAAGAGLGVAVVAGLSLVGLALNRTVHALNKWTSASWETIMRIGQYNGQLTAATAMLEANRQIRDIQAAQAVAADGAAFIKGQDRFEKNMAPVNNAITGLGAWIGSVALGLANLGLENLVNPILDKDNKNDSPVKKAAALIGRNVAVAAPNGIAGAVGEMVKEQREANKAANGVAAGVADLVGVARNEAKARAEKEAADRLKALQDKHALAAPQMDAINAMMNDLAAGRRPF